MTEYQPVVYVIDDDTGMLESTAWLLESMDIQCRTFADGARFLEAVHPDMLGCILLDVRMPGMGGLNVQQALREQQCPLPVILISGHADVPMVKRAFRGGATDFIEKPFNEQELLDVVQQALEQDRRVHERRALERAVAERFQALTPRERDLVEPLARGLRAREIAAELDIGARTAELYRSRVFQRLQVNNLAELVQLCIVAGVIDPYDAAPATTAEDS
ncbi:response regulator [Aquisalimonas sp.]|uniref:response regulator transcription factor n=1 Tax=unclassified Aquisalimonas TaxID=2644645 RepID=UPI0025C64F80|nr:response regulator [Aquisalimonas sp.]